MKQPRPGSISGERGPALEGAKYRAFGGVIHRILFNFGTVPHSAGSPLDAVKHAGKYPLIGWQQPAPSAPESVCAPVLDGARRAATDAIRK